MTDFHTLQKNLDQAMQADRHRLRRREAAPLQLAQRGVLPAFRALRQAVAQDIVEQGAAHCIALEATGQRVEQGAHQAASGVSRFLIQS